MTRSGFIVAYYGQPLNKWLNQDSLLPILSNHWINKQLMKLIFSFLLITDNHKKNWWDEYANYDSTGNIMVSSLTQLPTNDMFPLLMATYDCQILA